MNEKTGAPKVKVYRDKETDEPKGEASVSFVSPALAQAAIKQFNGGWPSSFLRNTADEYFPFVVAFRS